MQPPRKGRSDLILVLPLCPTVFLSLSVHPSACLPRSLCVSCRRTGGYEICSTCIRVNQPTLALQSTTPLGSWSERLGRRDSCVVDTQTSPTTYPLFSKASRRYPTHTHTHTHTHTEHIHISDFRVLICGYVRLTVFSWTTR